MSESKDRKKFRELVQKQFLGLADMVVDCNEPGEWPSITTNVTANPEGEGPVILLAIYPGTTPEHAKKIQGGLADMFKGLNDK